jgi:hypothetical protein
MNRRYATAVISSVPGIGAARLVALLMFGSAAAAAVGLMKLNLGIPGNSILLAALPMALGISLTPRPLAGTVMGVGALGTAWLLSGGGASYGAGSVVSLCLLGPMIDIALRLSRRGWHLYPSLLFTGVATNLLALGSRAVPKVLGVDVAGGRPFDTWWMQASMTYTICGAAAGLLCAFCLSLFNDRSSQLPDA